MCSCACCQVAWNPRQSCLLQCLHLHACSVGPANQTACVMALVMLLHFQYKHGYLGIGGSLHVLHSQMQFELY